MLLAQAGGGLASAQGRAPEIRSAVWLNAASYPKFPLKALRGKVILLFFWTMNDSNCLRAVPVVNRWYAQYKEKGFEVIGVHTPEWTSESAHSLLFQKAESLQIKFPIVVDEDSAVRQAYAALAWPSFVFIGREGDLRARYDSRADLKDIETTLKSLLDERRPQEP